MRIDPDTCRDPDLLAAEVRRLRAVIDAMTVVATDDPPAAVESVGDSPAAAGTSVETGILPEWLSRPYYVDPPSGWRYGFPRLYDPATDGDMREWMIKNGYPKRLTRLGLPCTFTAQTD